MILTERHLSITKTARYFANSPEKKIKTVLIAIHGYAQLAKDFMLDFGFLNSEDTLIIAPEGLSRFYFREKTGASWMTKEDRQNEITDYVNYLNMLLIRIERDYNLADSEKSLLGFSQGVHTAVRFFTGTNASFKNLILCSSDFPKDADFESLKVKSGKSKIYYINGNKDEIIKTEIFEAGKKLLTSHGIMFEEIVFDGAHMIHNETINKILDK